MHPLTGAGIHWQKHLAISDGKENPGLMQKLRESQSESPHPLYKVYLQWLNKGLREKLLFAFGNSGDEEPPRKYQSILFFSSAALKRWQEKPLYYNSLNC